MSYEPVYEGRIFVGELVRTLFILYVLCVRIVSMD